MAKLLPASLLTLLIVVVFTLLACGGGSLSHQLVSVSISPQTATASDFPNSMVQFTATGTFNRAPSPQTLNQAIWEVVVPSDFPTSDVATVDANGVAQCKTGFAGTVTIKGGGMVCPSNPMMGIPCQPIFGSAQLTCP